MPIYEYNCECGHEFEEMLTVSNRDQPTKDACPKCGEKKVTKGISASTMGADMNLSPDKQTGGDWSRLMDKVKKSAPKRYHGALDATKSNRAGGLGTH
tara:strand:+ start:2409 stop:2702 length:294 start_codon:yes stop_codon:yes gene_type:complete